MRRFGVQKCACSVLVSLPRRKIALGIVVIAVRIVIKRLYGIAFRKREAYTHYAEISCVSAEITKAEITFVSVFGNFKLFFKVAVLALFAEIVKSRKQALRTVPYRRFGIYRRKPVTFEIFFIRRRYKIIIRNIISAYPPVSSVTEKVAVIVFDPGFDPVRVVLYISVIITEFVIKISRGVRVKRLNSGSRLPARASYLIFTL